ncbi:hypothetical protein LguiA_030722 [Lonicera macranthoides]
MGKVPTNFGSLELLRVIGLEYNSLGSWGADDMSFLSSLANCSELEQVGVNFNQLGGVLPNVVGNFSIKLRYFGVAYNQISGIIPPELSNLVNLERLGMAYNQFEGQIPDNIGKLQKLVVLNIASNRLTGQIPSSVGNLSFLSNVERVQSSGILLEESSFLKVSYGELFKVTDGFSSTNLIGVGGFGSVYKGILDREQMTVAIKVLKLEHQGASKSFLAECKALRNIRHRNLVKLMTSCSSIDFQGNEFKALIYEFMPNGSLERWLHSIDETQTLDLHQRINIAIDVASALDYLHHHCENPILHCDLKPNNVLLDKDMVARLGDFGLARFLLVEPNSANQSKTIEIEGTIGYVAPEYGLGSQVSMNGDVYSYGIILLEMITGRSPVDPMFDEGLNLHNYARKALPDHVMEIVNPKLLSNDEEEEELKEVDNKKFSKHSRNGISNEEEVALKEADNKKSSKQSRNGNILEDCLIAIVKIGVACSMESPHERMDIDDAIHDLHLARDILEECILQHSSFLPSRTLVHRVSVAPVVLNITPANMND